MSAHAVGNQQQQRVLAVAVGDAVLVGPARSAPAFLVDGELHRSVYRLPRQAANFCSTPRTPIAEGGLDTAGPGSRSNAFCSARTLCGRCRWSRRRHQSMVWSNCPEYLPSHTLLAGICRSRSMRWSAAGGAAALRQANMLAPTL